MRRLIKGCILAGIVCGMYVAAPTAAFAAAPTPAAILLAEVKAAVAENPALADSVGDEALLQGVRRGISRYPEKAQALARVATRLKPHLSQPIAAIASQVGEAVPEWARAGSPAPQGKAETEGIFALGLEDLMNTKVITASKSKERAFDVPAAITVITNEDLRRSGQTTVMEALRMVPGMQVSRINSPGWAISARGFGDEYANKMLVLVDGRSIYTPTFSGVYWDLVNLPLEDIDRIEVIRGPGATVWGANAVNGVINIVTKESKYTQGAYASAGAGNHERFFGEGRVGGELGKNGHYRVYSRYADRSALEDGDGLEQNNAWWRMLTGARADWKNGDADDFTVQGEIQRGGNEQESLQLGPAPNDSEITASYLRGRWGRVLEDGSRMTLSGYLDQHNRETDVLEHRVTNLDGDLNISKHWTERNELAWGLGYRLSMDDYNTTPVLGFVPSEDERSLYSAFVQNKFSATERLDLILGTKLEHNDYTGAEVQPTAKFSYRPDDRSTWWGSIARAVRTPSRAEDSIRYTLQSIPGVPPTRVVITGNEAVRSEELIAYEMGYRLSPREGLIFDLSAYYNNYDRLTTLTQGTPFFDSGGIVVPVNIHDLGSGTIYGVEASANWQVTPSWLLAGYYAYGKLETDSGTADQLTLDYETLWPQHSFSVRSSYNITENVELDLALYYVSSLDEAREVDGTLSGIDAYLKGDARIGWRPWDGLELSLAGLNLLENDHREFVDSRFYPASQVGRSYYGKATWRF